MMIMMWFSWILWLFLAMQDTDAGKNNKRMKKKPPSSAPPPLRRRTDQARSLLPTFDQLHHDRTLDEWLAMSPAVLRLLATDNHITITPHDSLARTLHAFFQRQRSSLTTSPNPSSLTLPPPTLSILTTSTSTFSPISTLHSPTFRHMPSLPRHDACIPLARNPFDLPPDDTQPATTALNTGHSHASTSTYTSAQPPTPHSPPHAHFPTRAHTQPPTVTRVTGQPSLPPPTTHRSTSTTATSDPVITALPTSFIDEFRSQNQMLLSHIQDLNHRLLSLQQSHDDVVASIYSSPFTTTTTVTDSTATNVPPAVQTRTSRHRCCYNKPLLLLQRLFLFHLLLLRFPLRILRPLLIPQLLLLLLLPLPHQLSAMVTSTHLRSFHLVTIITGFNP